jgi:hypothetical protein
MRWDRFEGGSLRAHAALCALLLLAGGAGARAQEPTSASALPFGVGEICTFSIGYGPISAGEATISVEDTLRYDGQNVFHIRTRARSNSFFDAFFKVRDQADSYIDADSLFSRYFAKHLREGGYERNVEIHFDHLHGRAYFPDGRESEIPQGVQDVLSAFFRVRALELIDGEEIGIPTFGDKELYDMVVVVHRREVVDSPLGRVSCVVVQPKLAGDSGLFKHQGDLFVWITDDDRRIPIKMRANVPVGAIEARLKSYQPPRRERGP